VEEIMLKFYAWLAALFRAAALLGALGLIAIAIMTTADVSMRWLTGRAIGGVFELSGVLLVLVTFLPLGLVLFEDRQLRVDILPELLNGRPLAALDVLDCAIGILVFGLLLSAATDEFEKAYQGRFLLRGLIQIPTWIPTLMIWAGTLGAIIALVFKVVDAFRALAGKTRIGRRSSGMIDDGAV
jgi:TRAP-type C4-dicarboxylate transport system permease small subunit